MKLFITASLLLAALTSFGVSRIGGGKVNSLASGFELEVPAPFLNFQEFKDLVIANGPLWIQSGLPTQQFIHIREFSTYYANLSLSNRVDTENYFTSRGFKKVTATQSDCIDAYFFVSSTTTGIVATWGDGKGVTLTGPNTYLVLDAINTILTNLTIQPGACAWK